MKALLITLPKRSLIESRQCNGKRKKRNSVKMQHKKVAKSHENKSLMVPPKSLGAPGKYPLFPHPSLSVGLLLTTESSKAILITA